jgi:hypothetical protein
MPDIIVKQQPTTSLTVQSNSTQLLIKQAAANNITVSTTGSSYVLPAATNSTLGGIIVGDNLSINANGVLSAQAGGVTSFNNRTGNVTLTANDVLSTGTQYSQPVYDTYMAANLPRGGSSSGNELIRGIKLDKFWHGQVNQFYYGFFGMGYTSSFYAGVVDKATNNITSMIMLRPGTDSFGGFEIVAGEKSILVSPTEISFVGNTFIGGKVYCQSSTQFGQEPAFNEVLTRQSGDARYVKISSRN